MKNLANERQELDLLDTSECCIDATLANGRGGGLEIGNAKCGKGVNIMAIADRTSLSLSVSDFNRECLKSQIDTSLPSARLIRMLDELVQLRNVPRRLRLDYGPEFTIAVLRWPACRR